MGLAVVTTPSGGLPVAAVAASPLAMPVTEAANGRGIAVTKVSNGFGRPVTFVDVAGQVVPGSITWDIATIANATLSPDKLTVTNTGTTGEIGARGANAAGKSSGKYYFEVTATTVVGAGGGNTGIGVGTTGSTFSAMGTNATAGGMVYANNGGIYANGTASGAPGIGALASGQAVGVAIDLGTRKISFRKLPAGLWDGLVATSPETGGGATLPAGTMVPFCVFGGSGGTTGNVFSANFGASAFIGAVPPGYTPGWPA